jgi:hypothetical protein
MTTMQNSPPTQAGDAADHETRKAVFRSVARSWPSGVAVITTLDELGDRHGLTMSAAIALSLEPVQFLICVDDNSNTLPVLLRRGKFASISWPKGRRVVRFVLPVRGVLSLRTSATMSWTETRRF